MGGGIMQIITTGKENKHITGNPQTTFFKDVYFRHTNFSMETIPCVFNSTISNNNDTNVSVVIHKSGDLVHNTYLEFELELTVSTPTVGTSNGIAYYINFTNSTGYAVIKHVSLLLNNEEIDKQYGEWFDIWDELTKKNNNQDILVNKNPSSSYLRTNNKSSKLKCYVPLQFWFCRNPGLALPLIALQRVTVSMNFLFRNPYKLINTNYYTKEHFTVSYSKQPQLYVNYIFLDTKERKDFTQKKHQYLIEKVQFNGNHTLVENNELNFNNIVKEIIWVTRMKAAGTEYNFDSNNHIASVNPNSNKPDSIKSNNDYFNYHTDFSGNKEYLRAIESYEPFSDAELFINGSSRFSKKNASYFRTMQPYQYHTNVTTKNIYVYSFALKPEEHQPSGVCNVSGLKTISLKLYNPSSDMDILIFGYMGI